MLLPPLALKADEEQTVDLTGLWSISMTLENVTATYDIANAYAIAQQGDFVVTAEQIGSALVFSVPDPTVTVTGTVEGDTVTLHLTQELPEEAQADTFVADIVFQTDIPFCNETFGYYELEGTYSGSGYIMFKPENLEYKIPDFCTWSGIFEAFVVATDDPPEPGSVAHIIADGSVQTLLNVDAFTENLNLIETQVLTDILYAPTRQDARQAVNDGIRTINDLKRSTLSELRDIFRETRSLAAQEDRRFRRNESDIWECYLNNTAESRKTVAWKIADTQALFRSQFRSPVVYFLPDEFEEDATWAGEEITLTSGVSVQYGIHSVATPPGQTDYGRESFLIIAGESQGCSAEDLDWVQFIAYDWAFVNIDDDFNVVVVPPNSPNPNDQDEVDRFEEAHQTVNPRYSR
ncbi:MAG: hypothetical protein NUW37_18565 [Planctomycetes bacterium]|nr:hypothetical protein [Planctomycetota bacterium]